MSAIRPAPLPVRYADIDVIAGRPVTRQHDQRGAAVELPASRRETGTLDPSGSLVHSAQQPQSAPHHERIRHEAQVHRPSPLPTRLHALRFDRHRQDVGRCSEEAASGRRGARPESPADDAKEGHRVGDFVVGLAALAAAILLATSEWLGWPLPY